MMERENARLVFFTFFFLILRVSDHEAKKEVLTRILAFNNIQSTECVQALS